MPKEHSEPTGDLEQLQWVQRLAYRLCSDRALADDIGQEVLLAGFQAAPADRTERRAWLLGALRNRLRMARRSGARRSDHEVRAAGDRARDQAREGGSTASAPEAVLERFESHRRVSEAVARMREPYRSTLLRRFFEGLTPSAIAELESVPIGTVKTRITRGLKELRSELEDEFGGGSAEGGGWLAAIVPLAALHRDRILDGSASAEDVLDGPGLEATRGGWPPALTISGRAAALIAGGVTASFAAWVLSRPPVDESTTATLVPSEQAALDSEASSVPDHFANRSGRPPTADGARIQQGQEQTAEPEPASDQASAQASDQAAVALTVDVIYTDGQAVTGASVQHVPADSYAESTALGLTDGRGRVEARVPRASATLTCDQSHLAVVVPGSVLEVGTEQTATIVVAPPRTVQGIVVDSEGLAVEGASVTYRAAEDLRLLQDRPLNRATHPSWGVETDARGEFTLPGVPELPTSRIIVEHDRFARVELEVEDTGAVYERVELRGERGGLRGRVLDAEGLPVQGAYVVSGSQSTRSDNGGFFYLDLPTGQEVEVRGAAAGVGFGSWTGQVSDEARGTEAEKPIAIRLSSPPCRLRCRILLPSGEPATGLRVALLDRTDLGIVEQAAPQRFIYASAEAIVAEASGSPRSDLDGRFEFTVLKGRSYRILAVESETLAAVISAPLMGSELEHQLTFDPPSKLTTVRGTVTSADGQPLAGASITASVLGAAGTSSFTSSVALQGPRAVTDEQGRYEFESLSVGPLTQLYAFAGAHYDDSFQSALRGGDSVDFQLARIVPFLLQGTGSEALAADRFELRDPVTSEPLPLSQVEGIGSFSLLRGELASGRSPVYRVRAGRHLLVTMRGDQEILRTTVQIQDLAETQVIDI